MTAERNGDKQEKREAPHVPAAFINAIAEEGTKAEAIEWLQKTWNERCELWSELEALRHDMARGMANHNADLSAVPPSAARDDAQAIREMVVDVLELLGIPFDKWSTLYQRVAELKALRVTSDELLASARSASAPILDRTYETNARLWFAAALMVLFVMTLFV